MAVRADNLARFDFSLDSLNARAVVHQGRNHGQLWANVVEVKENRARFSTVRARMDGKVVGNKLAGSPLAVTLCVS
jgi:hypothetical protein